MFWAFCFFLRWSFTACRRAISGERIFLHRTGFPAILIRRVAGAVEYDKHAQLILAWIEASEYLYPDMRNGANEKFND